MKDIILTRQDNGVSIVQLNRPEVLNALNINLRQEIATAFSELNIDKSVRCIVITGNEKAFAAGADIKQIVEASAIEMMLRNVHQYWKPIQECTKPIIAAVNGFALGGGCELAMLADIIIAGKNAKFGQPEVKVGIMPGSGGTQRLTRAVGKYKAMYMLLTGDMISVDEAFNMGIVSQVVEDSEVLETAISIATKIASMPPLAVSQIKEVVSAGQDIPLESALMLERKAFQLLFDSEDQKEGMRAFIEKRKPEFKGK